MCKGESTYTSWEATRLFRTVIFPIRVSLRYFQQLKTFLTLSSFSLQFKVTVGSGSLENQTPKALTLYLGHLKFLPGVNIPSFPLFTPIQRASVFYHYVLNQTLHKNHPAF